VQEQDIPVAPAA
jgi:hypothetical protein